MKQDTMLLTYERFIDHDNGGSWEDQHVMCVDGVEVIAELADLAREKAQAQFQWGQQSVRWRSEVFVPDVRNISVRRVQDIPNEGAFLRKMEKIYEDELTICQECLEMNHAAEAAALEDSERVMMEKLITKYGKMTVTEE